jgi:hypothetical protein
MPEDVLYVSVSWREIEILEEVPLSAPSQEAAFLATDAPLPVGTMLILSPTAAEEIRVPARVVHGQEALTGKHIEPKTPGMELIFEAAGELLAPYLPGAEQEPAEEPNLEAAGGADDDFSQDAIPQSASRASGDYAEISDDTMAPEPALGDPEPDAYEEEEEEEELQYELSELGGDGGNSGHIALPVTAAGAMDSAISPQASGEINLSRMGGRYGSDPEAPDKVIVEVGDASMKAATADREDLQSFDDSEEDTKVEKPRKKRNRGRKKKKKK